MRAAIMALLPGDATIHEHLLQPLAEGERAAVAASISESLHDAPAPRRSLASSVAETRAIVTGGGRGATGAEAPAPLLATGAAAPIEAPPASGLVTSGGAFGTTVGRASDGAPLSTSAVPAARSLSPIIAAMAGAALLLAGAAAAYVVARPAPVAPQPALTSAPSVEPQKARTVRLVVIPPDATVDVDATPIVPKDGLVEIHGALGSVHAVHVKAGDAETTTNVVVTEDGALPPKIEVHPASVKPPSVKTGPPLKGALPLSKSSATPPPSIDFRTGR